MYKSESVKLKKELTIDYELYTTEMNNHMYQGAKDAVVAFMAIIRSLKRGDKKEALILIFELELRTEQTTELIEFFHLKDQVEAKEGEA
jgi:hypothetical protein